MWDCTWGGGGSQCDDLGHDLIHKTTFLLPEHEYDNMSYQQGFTA